MSNSTMRLNILKSRESALMEELSDVKVPQGEISTEYLFRKRHSFSEKKYKQLCELGAVRQCMRETFNKDINIDYKEMEYV